MIFYCEECVSLSGAGFFLFGYAVLVLIGTYAVQLDEGADHAGAKSALLAGCDVERHVLGWLRWVGFRYGE